MSRRVVGEIEPRLTQVELERAKRKAAADLGAYDYYLRALATGYLMTKDESEEVLRLAHKPSSSIPASLRPMGLLPGFTPDVRSTSGRTMGCASAPMLFGWRGAQQSLGRRMRSASPSPDMPSP